MKNRFGIKVEKMHNSHFGIFIYLYNSLNKVLPIHRTTIGLFLVDFYYSYDDENVCYITGNNSQSYSGY